MVLRTFTNTHSYTIYIHFIGLMWPCLIALDFFFFFFTSADLSVTSAMWNKCVIYNVSLLFTYTHLYLTFISLY